MDAAVAASAAAATGAASASSSFHLSPLVVFHQDVDSLDDDASDGAGPVGPKQRGAIAAALARVAGALPDPQQAAAALRALLRAPSARLAQRLERASAAAAFAAAKEGAPTDRAAARGEAERALAEASGELCALGAIVECGAEVAMRSGAGEESVFSSQRLRGSIAVVADQPRTFELKQLCVCFVSVQHTRFSPPNSIASCAGDLGVLLEGCAAAEAAVAAVLGWAGRSAEGLTAAAGGVWERCGVAAAQCYRAGAAQGV